MAFRNMVGDVVFNGALTASANGAAMTMPGGNGSFLVAIHTTVVTGTTPTLAVKLQDSPDNSTWTDITGAVTSANITAAGNVIIAGRSTKQYVRVVTTIGGTTPSFTTSVMVLGCSA